MNQQQQSRKHHYVPAFLMRPWTRAGLLNGYSWDPWKHRLNCTKWRPASGREGTAAAQVQGRER